MAAKPVRRWYRKLGRAMVFPLAWLLRFYEKAEKIFDVADSINAESAVRKESKVRRRKERGDASA